MQLATATSSLLVRPEPRRLRAPTLLQNTVAALFGVRGLSTRAILTALGVAFFVDVIILTVEAATLWSVTGYFHLPVTAALIFAVAIFVPAKWMCWKVAQLSLQAEARGDDVPED